MTSNKVKPYSIFTTDWLTGILAMSYYCDVTSKRRNRPSKGWKLFLKKSCWRKSSLGEGKWSDGAHRYSTHGISKSEPCMKDNCHGFPVQNCLRSWAVAACRIPGVDQKAKRRAGRGLSPRLYVQRPFRAAVPLCRRILSLCFSVWQDICYFDEPA